MSIRVSLHAYINLVSNSSIEHDPVAIFQSDSVRSSTTSLEFSGVGPVRRPIAGVNVGRISATNRYTTDRNCEARADCNQQDDLHFFFDMQEWSERQLLISDEVV